MTIGSSPNMQSAQRSIETRARTTLTSEGCATSADIVGHADSMPWDDTMAAENAETKQRATRIRPPKQIEWEAAWRTSQTMSSFDEN